jgi:hypothetical protein
LALYVAILVFMLHATTAALYGTVRYSWAWKHIGIVDFIQRNGFVQPDIAVLDVYHNWPSFFGLSAFFTEIAGFESAASFAAWAPATFNALFAVALGAIYRALTGDRRVVWTAVWLFLVTNWVGQDYFSPQAFAFFLYLVVIGVLLRWFGRRPPRVLQMLGERARFRWLGGPRVVRPVIDDGRVTTSEPLPAEEPLAPSPGAGSGSPEFLGGEGARRRSWMMAAIVLVVFGAIITSHPLTPLMLLAALTGLVLLGLGRNRSLPIALAALTAGWMITGAGSFVERQFADRFGDTGAVASNFGEALLDLSGVSTGQAVAAWMGRGLVLAAGVLAIAGAVRWIRGSESDLRPMLLAVFPVAILLGGSYDGEALFRIYLFSLPFLAFLASRLFFPSVRAGRSMAATATASATAAVLLGAFLFAHFGKDDQYYFTEEEVRAAEFVYENAAPGSLLIEGSRNYPSQFTLYEQYVYVPISREPATTHDRIAADPVGVMEDWMCNPDYPEAYLIITRSQKAEIDATGVMPAGSLDALEDALLRSPLFEAVVGGENATVFRLLDEGGGG